MSDTPAPAAPVSPAVIRIQKLQFIFDIARKAPVDAATHDNVKQSAIDLAADLGKLEQFETPTGAGTASVAEDKKVDDPAS